MLVTAVVVGFKMDLVMEAAADDAVFVYNELYDQTNTAKSPLKALRLAPPDGCCGSMLFVPGLLDVLRPHIDSQLRGGQHGQSRRRGDQVRTRRRRVRQ